MVLNDFHSEVRDFDEIEFTSEFRSFYYFPLQLEETITRARELEPTSNDSGDGWAIRKGGSQWRRDRLGLRGSFRRRLGNHTRSDVLLFSIGKWCGMERFGRERKKGNRGKKEKEEPRRGHMARFRTNTTQMKQSNQRKQAIISAAQPEGIRGDRHERTHTHSTETLES